MKFTYVTALPLLSLISSIAAAGTCSSSGARSWPPVGDCSTPSKFDTAVQTCRACCLNDQPCFTACLKAAGIGTRDVVGDKFRSTVHTKRALGSRAIALSCGTNENCYKYTDGSLLCLNLGTGLYHDDIGGNGDYFSGKYTGPDGRVQTGTGTPSPTASRTSQAARSTAPATASSEGGSRSTAPAQSQTGGAASTSPSSGAAVENSPLSVNGLFLGANVGLLGLMAGLVF